MKQMAFILPESQDHERQTEEELQVKGEERNCSKLEMLS